MMMSAKLLVMLVLKAELMMQLSVLLLLMRMQGESGQAQTRDSRSSRAGSRGAPITAAMKPALRGRAIGRDHEAPGHGAIRAAATAAVGQHGREVRAGRRGASCCR